MPFRGFLAARERQQREREKQGGGATLAAKAVINKEASRKAGVRA